MQGADDAALRVNHLSRLLVLAGAVRPLRLCMSGWGHDLRTRVVPSTRIVKRGNRQRTVEMRADIRILPEAEIIPELPYPQNMPNLVQCHSLQRAGRGFERQI